ncbi:hypothetical protein [Synechocystis sp. PCC 7509]|uniref:hypothetical protein n=1 Tax=Synechocystis sp. PCC 7509 TaxID=927677 RepID=UPI0002ABEDE4|nr:hypothetical protein [Synechocystis sp. PCC 7509]
MNPLNPRFLSSVYRKEPIPSFLVTIGLVDAAIGGLSSSISLFSLGIVTVGGAIAFRWLSQQRPTTPKQSIAQTYLPPASSNSVPKIATPKRKRSI